MRILFLPGISSATFKFLLSSGEYCIRHHINNSPGRLCSTCKDVQMSPIWSLSYLNVEQALLQFTSKHTALHFLLLKSYPFLIFQFLWLSKKWVIFLSRPQEESPQLCLNSILTTFNSFHFLFMLVL